MQRTIIGGDIPSDMDDSDMDSNYSMDDTQIWEPSSDEEIQTYDRDNTPVPNWDDPEMYDILDESSESNANTDADMDIPGSSNSEADNASPMEDEASGEESMLNTDEDTQDAGGAHGPAVASNHQPQNPSLVDQTQVLPVDLRANRSAGGATRRGNENRDVFGNLHFEIFEVINNVEVLLMLNDD